MSVLISIWKEDGFFEFAEKMIDRETSLIIRSR